MSFLAPPRQIPVTELATDASGCGAWHSSRWFQVAWDDTSQSLPIAAKKLLPIVLACEIWGCGWSGRLVRCHCDNQVVVAGLRSRTSRDTHCLHMLRALAFVEARYQFHLQPLYINTKANHLVGDLSRNNLSSFFRKVPDASKAGLSVTVPPESVGGSQHGLGLAALGPSVRRYFQEGLAPATHRSYDTAARRFGSFCERFQLVEPFPVSQTMLCSFAAHLADQGLSPQTIKTYLAGVRNMQLSLGLPDPRDQSSLRMLRRVLAGISRANHGTTSARVRLPVTPSLLRQICHYLEATVHNERVVLWAICCLAFFGCFRLGELLLESPASFDHRRHLAWGDVAVDNEANPRTLRIHLKQSKTDQFGRGADVVVGTTGRELCPVSAVLGYIAIRGSQPGPFFLKPRAGPITKAHFVGELRTVISSLGFPQEQFAGHSFRIGAATSAALAGMEDSSIQLLGRWSSAAFLRYVRTPPAKLAALSGILISNDVGLQEDQGRSAATGRCRQQPGC